MHMRLEQQTRLATYQERTRQLEQDRDQIQGEWQDAALRQQNRVLRVELAETRLRLEAEHTGST